MGGEESYEKDLKHVMCWKVKESCVSEQEGASNRRLVSKTEVGFAFIHMKYGILIGHHNRHLTIQV